MGLKLAEGALFLRDQGARAPHFLQKQQIQGESEGVGWADSLQKKIIPLTFRLQQAILTEGNERSLKASCVESAMEP